MLEKDTARKERLFYLDFIRFLAIVFMVVFHFCYDLNLFKVLHLNFQQGFWYFFPRLIVFLFFFCVGVSLKLYHSPQVKWKKFGQRFFELCAYAGIISLLTYFLYPQNWIYFGTLHCIALASLLALPFLNHPRLCLVTIITILISQFGLGFDVPWVSSIINKPSMDFIPVYPWLWVLLLGIVLTPAIRGLKNPPLFMGKGIITWCSKKSLYIYLFHQLILSALAYLISLISK